MGLFAKFKAGLAKTTTAETLNKVCASGMLSVAYAQRLIDAGAQRVVVAGGMESMTNAPYLLLRAREGYRMGNSTVVDAMINDGLWEASTASPWAAPPWAQASTRRQALPRRWRPSSA